MPRKKRSLKVEICSVALMCLTLMLVQLIPMSQAGSIATETVAASDDLTYLTPGSTIRRELPGAGKDVFGINVEAGKLLRFSIDKGDLGLSTVIYGPTGTKLLERVSQDFESVEVSFPADVAGVYKIELQSRENTQAPRQYDLTVSPLKSITPRDRLDGAARLALAQAEVLRAQGTEASFRQAVEKFDEAASTWTSVLDSSNAARATLKSADVCFLLSNYPKASERYEKALTLAAKTGDGVTQALALTQLGRVYSNRGDNKSAERYIENAVELLKHDKSGFSIVKNAMGRALSASAEVIYAKGNLPKAAEQFARAFELLDQDRRGQANVHMFNAYIAGASQPEKAKSEILQARSLYQAINDKDGEGLALIGLGLYYSSNGKEHPAVDYHREAIAIFEPAGDRLNHAIALNAIGQVYEGLYQFGLALMSYEDALRHLQEIDAVDITTMALLKVGTMHRRMKHFEEALKYLDRCRDLSAAAGKLRNEAAAINEIAGLYADQHKFAEATREFQRGLKIYEGLGDSRGKAIAINDYGDSLLGSGQAKEALKMYQRAVPLSEQLDDKGILTATIYNLANAYRALGDYQTARSYVEKSLKILEDVRNDVGSPESRAAFLSGVWRHYELDIDILMQLHRQQPQERLDIAAFLLNDKSRARLLLDLINKARESQHDGPVGELLVQERELRAYLARLTFYQADLSLNKRGSTELADVKKQIAELLTKYQEVRARLNEQMPNRSSLDRFTPTSLDQIQKQLGSNDTLLDFALGDERSYLWVVTSGSFQSYELPSGRIIEQAASELDPLITARQEQNSNDPKVRPPDVAQADRLFEEKAMVLSNMLLGPVAQKLERRRLLVVAEGALQNLPFEALPFPGEPNTRLAVRNEVDRTPSISTLIAIRTEAKRVPAADKVAAVFADPVFSKSDDRLRNESLAGAIASAAPGPKANEAAAQTGPELRDAAPQRLTHSGEEADAISAMAPRGTTMIAKGFDATYETAMSSTLGQYQIVHFATHGLFDSEHPELSGIVLSMVDRNGGEKNGLMPLHDIYNLSLSAELTVLSACQTALGKDVKGEGLVGLTHSFISAGSKSVVATLWKVDDRATAFFMAEFYRALLEEGMTTGAALRAAKLKMMQDKRWSAPYYWAGFVLQGEYTNRITVERHSWFGPVVLLLSLVLVSSGVILWQRRRSVSTGRV